MYKILYTFYMIDLATIFSSMPRIRILRTLYQARGPLPLRQISCLSSLPLFSVQRTLKQLREEKIIGRKEKKPYVFFELNENYPAYRLLAELFHLEDKHRIADQANRLHRKALSVLDFAGSASDFLGPVKRAQPWT